MDALKNLRFEFHSYSLNPFPSDNVSFPNLQINLRWKTTLNVFEEQNFNDQTLEFWEMDLRNL